jgi:protein required for attachment to host cells
MPKMSICVVVANSSKAKLMLAEDAVSELIEISNFAHPESSLREQDLVSDSPGGAGDSVGPGRHSMGHEQEARQREAELFAQELMAEVEKLRQKTDLRRIYLVAPPKFLGFLRTNISKPCKALLEEEINKDLVTHDTAKIRSYLPKRL